MDLDIVAVPACFIEEDGSSDSEGVDWEKTDLGLCHEQVCCFCGVLGLACNHPCSRVFHVAGLSSIKASRHVIPLTQFSLTILDFDDFYQDREIWVALVP